MLHVALREVRYVTKEEREKMEYQSLFTDERYAKKAWKKLIGTSLESDAAVLPHFVDNKGEISPQSQIYNTAYQNVKDRLQAAGLSRSPMKAEVLVEANVIRAAFDTSTFNILLDRTAGKVKEEISIGVGAFEELTDEELQVLADHRQKQLESKPILAEVVK